VNPSTTGMKWKEKGGGHHLLGRRVVESTDANRKKKHKNGGQFKGVGQSVWVKKRPVVERRNVAVKTIFRKTNKKKKE